MYRHRPARRSIIPPALMLEPIGIVLIGLVLLYYGAETLVEGASTLALAAGLTPLVVGLTVVAYGTSLPELAVSVTATLNDQGGLAIGNVVGSNICNIGVVLGFAAVCRPLVVTTETTRIYIPFMVVAGIMVTLMLTDNYLSRWEGAILVAGITLYTVFGVRRCRRQIADQAALEPVEKIENPPLLKPLGLTVLGLGILLLGGKVLVHGSVELAKALHVSEAVIALTVVALGTSAPDLAASAIAARRGHGELAAGNAIGSVLFNLLNVLGVAALVRPITASGIDPVDHLVQLAFLAVTLPMLATGLVMKRWEGGLCLAGYVAYVVYRWPA